MRDIGSLSVEETASYIEGELESGYSQQQVSSMVIHRGIPAADAIALVAEVDEARKARNVRHRRGVIVSMVTGAILTVLGVGASLASYSNAQSGETYVLYFGCVLAGVFLLFRGLSRMR
jgi:hypothetical protein